MKIAVIVPFYNEQENLVFFIREWENFLNRRKKIRAKLFFYFIDDGSTDRSIEIIKKNTKHIYFTILRKKNSGHGETCKLGYNLITKKNIFDYILQIDSDNQCDPKYFIKMYNLILKKKYNFIFGYRKYRADGRLRFLLSRIMSLVFFFKKFCYIKDLNTPYRIMKVADLKEVLLSINSNKIYNDIKLYNCLLSYFIQKKFNICWIDINFRDRHFGKSKITFRTMSSTFFNFITKI